MASRPAQDYPEDIRLSYRRLPVIANPCCGALASRISARGVENQNQNSSCINDEVGEVFEVMTDLKYAAFSIRAAEILGPTITAIPASRRAATPRPSTRGFGSVMQHTTLFTPASIKASVHGGVRLPFPRWQHGSRLT